MSQRGGRWLPGQRARGSRGPLKESHCSPLLCCGGRRAWRHERGVWLPRLLRLLLLLPLLLFLCLRARGFCLLFLLCLRARGLCMWLSRWRTWHCLYWRWRQGLLRLWRRRRRRHWGRARWRRQGRQWLCRRCRHCGTRRRCWRWWCGCHWGWRGGSWRRQRQGLRGARRAPLCWVKVKDGRWVLSILGRGPIRLAGVVRTTVHLHERGWQLFAATAATHPHHPCLPAMCRTRAAVRGGVPHPLASEVLPRSLVHAVPFHGEARACQAAGAIWRFRGHRPRQRPAHARRRPAASLSEPRKRQRHQDDDDDDEDDDDDDDDDDGDHVMMTTRTTMTTRPSSFFPSRRSGQY